MAKPPHHLGPAVPVGSHAGVQVFRVETGFVKCFDEPSRCRRELAVLRDPPPCVVPDLLEAGDDWLMTADVRAGRDPRVRRVEALVEAARVLARVHGHRVSGSLPAAEHMRNLDARVHSAGVQGVFSGFIGVGDAFCHHDLHASNWIMEGGRPVGLLDWASSGHGDPEEDLARLLRGSSSDVEVAVIAAWEREGQRELDRRRLRAYAALLASEEGRVAPALEGAPFHGQRRTVRCVDKEEHPALRWLPISAPAIEVALEREGLRDAQVVSSFAAHACNDVLRIRWQDRDLILKVYNKPVETWLFELERGLAKVLEQTAACVPAPLALPSGGHLLRIGPRLAAVYPDCGDERPDLSAACLRRLAMAQAAFVSAESMSVPLAGLPDPAVDRWTGGGLSEDTRGRLAAILERTREASVGLPVSTIHGSFHRDHTSLMADGRVAIFDLEKARRGPRIVDVVNTAYHLGYRNNDERLEPRLMVFYLCEVHRHLRLGAEEIERIPNLLLRAFVLDLAAVGASPAHLSSHLRLTFEFEANVHNIARSLDRYLD